MGGVVKGVLGGVASLFGGSQGPSVSAPKVMPAPNDKAVREAERRRLAKMQTRGGRASTIFSDDGGEQLGG